MFGDFSSRKRSKVGDKVTPGRGGPSSRDGSISGKLLNKFRLLKSREKKQELIPEEKSARPGVGMEAQNNSTPKKAHFKFNLKFSCLRSEKREPTPKGENPSPTGARDSSDGFFKRIRLKLTANIPRSNFRKEQICEENSPGPGRTATGQDGSTSGSFSDRKRPKLKPKMLLLGFRKKDKAQTLGENPDPRTTTGGDQYGSKSGAFNNARNMVIDNAIMWEGAQFHQTVHNTVVTQTAVLQNLVSRSCPYVAVDSGARYPPPKCHPGTRRQILGQLESWMEDPKRQQKMIWVKGLAGIGKSAIVQTFAEKCMERNRLGASFFFKREWQIDSSTLVPTIACQFTIYIPEYQQLLFDCLLRDPSILDKAPRVQFTNLIIEPISTLQSQGHKINQEPLIVILDGLEECKGADAQGDIVEMISEAVRLKEDLPLLWLISSRPLEYLRYAFSKCDTSSSCSWGEVQVDEAEEDVCVYLRDRFNNISERYGDFIGPSWPSDEQVKSISKMTNGFFALAAAIVRYVDDSKRLHPMKRLTEVETLLRNCGHSDAATLLQVLDQLNTCLQSESTLVFE